MQALQRAFAASGAFQCGFCTPGMLVAAHALLAPTRRPTTRRSGAPSRATSAAAPATRSIIAAVQAAAAALHRRRSRGMSAPAGTAVGLSVPQLEGDDKLCGSAQYIADLHRPGMLHGAILQSPHAHARIRGYDLSAARALPGVRAIVTGDDLDERHRMGAFIKDEPAFAKGKVRYVGEIVAAVAADTEAIAREATRLIRVDYEELPAVSIRRRRSPPAPRSFTKARRATSRSSTPAPHGNLCSRTDFTSGDVDAAWAHCDAVVERPYQTQAQAHLSLEPVGALAEIEAGRPHHLVVGEPVGVPRAGERLRVAGPADDPAALPDAARRRRLRQQDGSARPAGVVLLAMKARRTVRLVLSREEDFETVRARHPFTIRIKTGARRDGTLRRPRDRAAARRRRLRRRQPRRPRLRPVDAVRPLPHPARARPRPGGLHQQAALRRLPRLRRAAGHLRLRIAARRARRRSSASTRIALRRRNMLARRRPVVRRPGDPLQRPGRVPGHRRARIRLEHAASAPLADAPAGPAPAPRPRHRRCRRTSAACSPPAPSCACSKTAACSSTPARSTSARARTRC